MKGKRALTIRRFRTHWQVAFPSNSQQVPRLKGNPTRRVFLQASTYLSSLQRPRDFTPQTQVRTILHQLQDLWIIRCCAHTPDPVRGLLPLEKVPGVISLLAGKPNPETFPISSFQVTVRVPHEGGSLVSIPEERKLEISDSRMADALQYGPTSGYEPLIAWLEGLQARVHGRTKGEGWRISIGSGSQDLLYKVRHVGVLYFVTR